MKYLAFTIAACSALLLSSCSENSRCVNGSGKVEKRIYTTGDFRHLNINGSQEYFIRKGAEHRLEVEAQPNIHERLNAKVDSGELSLEVAGCIRSFKPIKVYVTTPELENIELSGSAEVHVYNSFTVDYCRLSVSGSGEIHHKIVADELEVFISGSGDISLEGAADEQEVQISGSGNYEAYDLSSRRVRAKVSGSGDAELSVTEYLEADVSGSGNIFYQGSPALNVTITGSGSVQPKI